jgi:hypothetical protein
MTYGIIGGGGCNYASSKNIRVTLVLSQGYVAEKCQANRNHPNQIQNSNLEQCMSWELGDGRPHPI